MTGKGEISDVVIREIGTLPIMSSPGWWQEILRKPKIKTGEVALRIHYVGDDLSGYSVAIRSQGSVDEKPLIVHADEFGGRYRTLGYIVPSDTLEQISTFFEKGVNYRVPGQ